MMFSCNCLNITVEVEKPEKITKEGLKLNSEELAHSFFNKDVCYIGKLVRVVKTFSGLSRSTEVGLWTIGKCLNCEVETHATFKSKSERDILVNIKLLNEDAMKHVKSSNLVSSVFHIVINPNSFESDHPSEGTYLDKKVDKYIKDLNDVVTNLITKEEAAVEERIKKFSDEQYELLNNLKDKAYKEREVLVRRIQKAARDSLDELSPKSPKVFGSPCNNSPPFSAKRPKSKTIAQNNSDLIFDFDTDRDYALTANFTNPDFEESDYDDVEEAEDAISEASGMKILQGKTVESPIGIAKSCPVDIPIFSHSLRNRSQMGEILDKSPPIENEKFDIAESIKALAQSVHGDAIFGELPRPRFSTQI